MNFLNNEGIWQRLPSGCCRIGVDGNIAIRTTGGYKTYNHSTGALVNCDNFVFNMGDEMFFTMPATRVAKGDIILIGREPKCVIEAKNNAITVLNYENGAIETIVPERHMFLGKAYFFTKIFSPFGNGTKGAKNIGKMMMAMQMMGNGQNTNDAQNNNGPFGAFGGAMGQMLGASMAMQMMGSMFGENNNMFEDMFDGSMFGGDEEDEDEDATSPPPRTSPRKRRRKKKAPVAVATENKE